jgi:uncharacterized SAM-binding protein YcdF (DUF218 family)
MTRFGEEERRSQRQMMATLVGMLGGALLLFLLFFIIFAQSLRAGPENVPQADGIVVFTGTSPVRIETGLKLLAAGKGQRLLISGLYENQDFDMILAMAGADGARLRCCIDLDYRATNTVGNTQETALWTDVHEFSSLIVVTSSHHMPRAFLELRRTLPTTSLSAYPVLPPNVRLDYWYAYPGTMALLLGEYMRYLYVLSGLPGFN